MICARECRVIDKAELATRLKHSGGPFLAEPRLRSMPGALECALRRIVAGGSGSLT